VILVSVVYWVMLLPAVGRVVRTCARMLDRCQACNYSMSARRVPRVLALAGDGARSWHGLDALGILWASSCLRSIVSTTDVLRHF